MDILDQIEEILERDVRPMLYSHGGGARLAGFSDGVVRIELQGACAGCPSADQGTKEYIEERLRAQLPEVRGVELSEAVSPELLDFARKLLRHEP